jgi:hypothetical protein
MTDGMLMPGELEEIREQAQYVLKGNSGGFLADNVLHSCRNAK